VNFVSWYSLQNTTVMTMAEWWSVRWEQSPLPQHQPQWFDTKSISVQWETVTWICIVGWRLHMSVHVYISLTLCHSFVSCSALLWHWINFWGYVGWKSDLVGQLCTVNRVEVVVGYITAPSNPFAGWSKENHEISQSGQPTLIWDMNLIPPDPNQTCYC